MDSQTKAVLMLEDGTTFEGLSFGAQGTTYGEICFNTGMTGYQEVFTDPSYFRQILIMNAAHIGNYGVKPGDVESKGVKIAGLVARNLSVRYSRPQADSGLHEYLQKEGIVAIEQLDTRALVTHIRENGAMNALISTETNDLEKLRSMLATVPSMQGLELASQVSTKEMYTLGNSNAAMHIAVLDFGVKQYILQSMIDRGARLSVFPSQTSFNEINAVNPDGYFVSNGPGDPAAMPEAIDTVKQILTTGKPLFGICLGHQLIALACGAKTYKMHHGHRGLNHPVLNIQTGLSEISTQNHGFAVDRDSVTALPDLEITHVNLNDQTLEGIRLKDKPVFSVQYHPEATPGPHDSRYLFDDFIQLIQKQTR